MLDYALTSRRLWTVFGWNLHVEGKANGRSLRNFPMQANGAEMLRLACCLAVENGIRIVAPIHDAVLIEAPLEALNTATTRMQEYMRQASALVLNGFELRAEAETIAFPNRYVDDRGTAMWKTVNGVLKEMQYGGNA